MSSADDLPLWGFIGDKETVESGGKNYTLYYLFAHYIFTLSYNGDKVRAFVLLDVHESSAMPEMFVR